MGSRPVSRLNAWLKCKSRSICYLYPDSTGKNEKRTYHEAGNRQATEPQRFIDQTAASAYIAAMAPRDIIVIPDKRLRQVSKPVAKIDSTIRELVEDMFEAMYAAPGIGLAAIQVGEPRRVVTLDLAKKDEPKEPQVFINPEIVWSSDEKNIHEEGCLSIPEYYEEIERPAAIKVKFTDIEGQAREVDATGILATCLQHEIDHLNGVLFIDYLSKLKRDRVTKKFAKAAKLSKT
jgi:peptide deformylase